MALRNIREDGDEILRKTSRKVEKFDLRLSELIDDMFETMYAAEGVGLAGVQVGILKRVVVIDTYEEGEKLEMINPEILEMSGEEKLLEGCLSVPGKRGYVMRPTYVKVKAYDRNGNEFIREGEGLLAQAMCHEIEHLDGKLFTDKVIEYADEQN